MTGTDKRGVLKDYFGHESFRPGQELLVDALLSGRDALGVMPTGAGKSVCYQVPALLLPGVTVVVSPLISLMEDQVAALVQAGVPAGFLNSSLSAAQYREMLRRAAKGAYKLIYVAPERLATADFLQLAEELKISLVAVDEAHCISQWGQDFRPSYLRILDFIDALPIRPTVAAFTATATGQVKEDIVRVLRLEAPLLVATGFDRPNLSFEVLKPKGKGTCLEALLRSRREKSGIIYCATRKSVEAVCARLQADGLPATRYHAGLDGEERRRNQEDFVYDRAPIMVATNAFGMGIDKSNVSFVIHYNMPKNLESYYQEAGRAGRDGEPADCILLYAPGDVQTAKFLINSSGENEELDREARAEVLRASLERLEQMAGYCKTRGCLRAYLLAYFGEILDGPCGNCGNCKGAYTDVDITVQAQKILSCVVRAERKFGYGFGAALYLKMLCGSRDQRVLQLGLDKLPTYGLLREEDRRQVREYLDYLTGEDYLQVEKGELPILRPGRKAEGVLFRGERVVMPMKAAPPEARETRRTKRDRGAAPAEVPAGDEGLLSTLKVLRTKLAAVEGVPAYIVFSNAALADMAARRPRGMEEFLQVSGVGQAKAGRYGAAFLAAIAGEEQGD